MKILSILFILLSNHLLVFSQCTTCPSPPACSGENGAVYNNANINSGETYWYTGSGDNYNINFGGGTLIVCGDLTIGNMNFNGESTIYITSSGNLTVNSNINMSGANIYNYGTLNVGDVNIQGSNSHFINCNTNSSLTASNISVQSSDNSFVNYGNANIDFLKIQGTAYANKVCLEINSCTNLTNFENNCTNSVNAPSGDASLSYTNNAHLNNDVSSTSSVIVCKATGATTSASATFGSATVLENCSSCSEALPVKLLNFNAKAKNNKVVLDWTTSSEINNDFFLIERSSNAINFEQIGNIDGAGNSSKPINYKFYDTKPYKKQSYYRLKQIDFNGTYSYSSIKSVYLESISIINIYPNPANNKANIIIGSPNDIKVKIQVYNTLGQTVINFSKEFKAGVTTLNLNTSLLSEGTYLFRVKTPDDEKIEKYFIVNRN